MSSAARGSTHPEHAPWLAHYPAGVDWSLPLAPSTLPALFDAAIGRFGPKTAANFLGRTTTYADLGRQVARTAAGLQRAGVGKGTKVGLLLPNCVPYIVYYFAVQKLGGVIVNYNPLYTVEELGHQIRDSGTELMVTLDLKPLFDKVENLLETGVLARAAVVHFPPLLPGRDWPDPAKRLIWRLYDGLIQALL